MTAPGCWSGCWPPWMTRVSESMRSPASPVGAYVVGRRSPPGGGLGADAGRQILAAHEQVVELAVGEESLNGDRRPATDGVDQPAEQRPARSAQLELRDGGLAHTRQVGESLLREVQV